jgi:hypothetical protein
MTIPSAAAKSEGEVSEELRIERDKALRKACEEVQMLLRRNDARDASERYQIGCIIRDVRNDVHRFGEGSVGKIARSVGRDADTLYQYADVAETWSQAEIARLLERKTMLGVPLSFSHLIWLSKVRRNRDLLHLLTNRAFDGISVRHLRALVDEQRRGNVSEGDTTTRPTTRLSAIIKRSSGLIEAARSLQEHLGELQTVASTPALEQLLRRAIDAQDDLRQLCANNVQRLADERARVLSELAAQQAGEDDLSETFRKEEASAESEAELADVVEIERSIA